MNARLKELAQRSNMRLDKIQALVAMFDGDESWVERIILGADTAQKEALAAGVAYKVVEQHAWSMAAAFQGRYDGGNR